MPAVIATLTPRGLVEPDVRADSLAEAARYEPEGYYTVSRTYQRDRAVLLDAHLDRLEESARLEGLAVALDRPALRAALRLLIDRAGFAETRFRLTLPRRHPENVCFSLEPLAELPSEVRRRGISAATLPMQRLNPRVKTNAWIARRAAARAQLPEGVYEGLLLSPSAHVLEGLTSNFFAVAGDRLYTAREGVLMGIARRIVLEVAGEVLPVSVEPLPASDLAGAQEAFLTSSSRGVLPVVAVDGHPIGEGTPGGRTQEIARRYDAWVGAHLEPI